MGVFGGVKSFIILFVNLSLSVEHNSKGINTGFKLNLISKFNLMFGFGILINQLLRLTICSN